MIGSERKDDNPVRSGDIQAVMNRMFLLSPASTHGRRAQLLFRDAAAFPIATAVRSPGGAPLGDVFAFLSGLYFRGNNA
jgi:hypothetical protein